MSPDKVSLEWSLGRALTENTSVPECSSGQGIVIQSDNRARIRERVVSLRGNVLSMVANRFYILFFPLSPGVSSTKISRRDFSSVSFRGRVTRIENVSFFSFFSTMTTARFQNYETAYGSLDHRSAKIRNVTCIPLPLAKHFPLLSAIHRIRLYTLFAQRDFHFGRSTSSALTSRFEDVSSKKKETNER